MALNAGLFCADVPLRNYSLTVIHTIYTYSVSVLTCYYGTQEQLQQQQLLS